MLKHALSATATVAPLCGAMFTLFEIPRLFPGCPCGGSAEIWLGVAAGQLSKSLLPFAYGLGIGILARVARRGDSSLRERPSGAGFDRGARALADAIGNRRVAVIVFGRGQLDSLPVVANLAVLAGILALLAGMPWEAFAAAGLMILNRLAYRYLDIRHDAIQTEMTAFDVQ